MIDVFTKYALVKRLKDKKAKIVLNGFIEVVNRFTRKPNQNRFYNSAIQNWLDDNDILMYSTHHEGNPVAAERFIRTLKDKIYKKMTANYNKSCLGYLNKFVDEYSNNDHRSISRKPINTNYSVLTKEIEVLELLSTKIFLAKATKKIGKKNNSLLILY